MPGAADSCRVCSGELTCSSRATAGRRSPTRSRRRATSPAATATCSSCRECGTVQQPVLPAGAQLHDLYRDMRDDDYLAEEAGRRATARAAARPDRRATSPRGRLLDVGCGHGLLLDEARRRGYERDRPRAARATARGTPRRARPRRARARRSRRSPTTASRASTSSSSPTCSSTSTTRSTRSTAARACCARRRAVRRHAGPVVADGARWPARAGGATCPRTPACCRARTLRELIAAARAGRLRPTCRSCARSRRGAG